MELLDEELHLDTKEGKLKILDAKINKIW